MTGRFRISEAEFWHKVNAEFGKGGGIYRVFCIQDGQVIAINRLLGCDYDGTLYLGKASSFLDRVISLKKSIDPEYLSDGHIAGRRYKSHDGIKSVFPYSNLFVQLTRSEIPAEDERNWIEKYRLKFGELPPLNAI